MQYFLDLVLERDAKNKSSVADFLEYWDKIGFEKSIPSPEGTNAIRIMTIHKSKGLEFPVVIYPLPKKIFLEINLIKFGLILKKVTNSIYLKL